MALGNLNVGSYKLATDTGNVCTRPGVLLGFYVGATSSGTLTFYDSASTTTTKAITGTVTPAVGWHSLPVAFTDGLYVVKGGASISVTLVFA